MFSCPLEIEVRLQVDELVHGNDGVERPETALSLFPADEEVGGRSLVVVLCCEGVENLLRFVHCEPPIWGLLIRLSYVDLVDDFL
jgi:hypothetical protein